ncbi:MurR/RpiR family transcriptional regulator [Aurantimonas sp. MSK8Z-1]|uniref:MurR/RpiR family transcriptional regulator n=1 Tax=Mangrovibrevibacter kandeliae TaxID=2968473 RepID=UPI00211919C0|nr:MurR/RpiR family transcriptional regulator [Aurantimonas sp. MSK8Z-1]MCW4116302.1 MurR/RpiR family transcriptional regulator [Aurantimonas sp. MSK8Z-1]
MSGREAPAQVNGESAALAAPIFDIIDRLRMRAEDGSKSEKRLALFVLDNAHFASTAAIADIADRCSISEPTVTRFARSLGCQGVADFKFRLAQALAVGGLYLNAAPLTPDEREARILAAVADGARNAIDRVREMTDMGLVTRAAEMLASAQHVLAFGSGGTSSWMAREAENRLFRLGLSVRAETDSQMQVMQASVAGPQTVLLAFSISGHGRGLVEAVQVAKTYRARTIALTAPGSPLGRAADIHLPFALPEDGNIYKPSSGRYGLLALLDFLAMATAEAIGPRMLEGIRRIKQTLNTHIVANPNLPIGD